MPSKKKVEKKPITIRLTYDSNGTVTSTPPSHFQEGDRVKFVSGNGGKVYVKLNSKAYKPAKFTPDSGPVKVIAAPTGTPSRAECGFVKKVKGKYVAYGWVPGRKSVMPLSTGIDTEP